MAVPLLVLAAVCPRSGYAVRHPQPVKFIGCFPPLMQEGQEVPDHRHGGLVGVGPYAAVPLSCDFQGGAAAGGGGGGGGWVRAGQGAVRRAIKQGIQSLHIPPRHGHMVIATNLNSLFEHTSNEGRMLP